MVTVVSGGPRVISTSSMSSSMMARPRPPSPLREPFRHRPGFPDGDRDVLPAAAVQLEDGRVAGGGVADHVGAGLTGGHEDVRRSPPRWRRLHGASGE